MAEEWIQVGNPVVTYRSGRENQASISKISRLTKTMFILENGDRFRIENLRIVGDESSSWYGPIHVAYLYSDEGRRVWEKRLLSNARHRARNRFDAWVKEPTRENRLEAIRALEDVPDE